MNLFGVRLLFTVSSGNFEARTAHISPLCSFSKLCNFRCDIMSHVYFVWMQIME